MFSLKEILKRLREGNHSQHYTAESDTEHDTVELCMACPCSQRASANIDTFPSAVVLPKQKPEDHSLEKRAV